LVGWLVGTWDWTRWPSRALLWNYAEVDVEKQLGVGVDVGPMACEVRHPIILVGDLRECWSLMFFVHHF
jgi:hypothetical protein